MKRQKIIVVLLASLAMAISIPNASLAQSSQSGQAPQPVGGVATVIGVDQPDNCLRIRSGPGNSYDIIGCATLGQQLNITGVWTSNDWAQLAADNGWIYGPQIQTDLRPPSAAFSQSERYAVVEEEYPVYYESYADSYLPNYGYSTYWYGGVPLYVYGVNVWRKHHPWWWYKNRNRHHNVWDRNRSFRQDVRTRGQRDFLRNRAGVTSPNVTRFNANRLRSGSLNTTRSFTSPNTIRKGAVGPRNFVPNRSGFTSPNVTQFNANRLRSGSSNVIRSGRSFSSPNTIRSFSRPNTVRSFSAPNTLRMGTVGTRNFTRSFSGGNTSGINSAARMGGGARIGGGVKMGGGGAHFSGGGRRR